jgi:hypothetical protein
MALHGTEAIPAVQLTVDPRDMDAVLLYDVGLAPAKLSERGRRQPFVRTQLVVLS